MLLKRQYIHHGNHHKKNLVTNFFKKNKIKIWSNLIPLHIVKEFFKIFPNNLPNYFKNIPLKLSENKSDSHTIKSCSGFLNYFLRSMVFYSPCDIEIRYDDKQAYAKFGKGDLNDSKRFTVHSAEQFLKHAPQNKYVGICKINLDIFIKAPRPIIVNECWWHFNDFTILPGIINTETYPMHLNLFIGLLKEKDYIFIPQNTPLCHLFMEDESKISIDFQKEKFNKLNYNNFNYLFNFLKKTILKTKYENN